MSILGWALGLAAFNALTDAEEKSEEARRAADDLRWMNKANERRISDLEDELRALRRERDAWRNRYSERAGTGPAKGL